MTDQDVYNLILQRNLDYFGVDIAKQLHKAGLIAAKSIIDFLHTNKKTSVSLVITDNYYAKYALATAIGFDTLRFPINIYCLTRVNKLRDQTAQRLLTQISELSAKYIKIYQDCKSEDIDNAQAFILALGEPNQNPSSRERESVKRVTHFNPLKINLEYPTKGFTWDLSISFDFAKTEDAVVVPSGVNGNMLTVGPGELEAVMLPHQRTHLSQNCKLTVITDSAEKYWLEKHKLYNLTVLDQKIDLNLVVSKFKQSDVFLLDLDNLFAELLLQVIEKESSTITRIEILSPQRKLILLKETPINNTFTVSIEKGVLTVSGLEIFTNIKKTARFNSNKIPTALAIDIAALLKFNHPWLAAIGGVVW